MIDTKINMVAVITLLALMLVINIAWLFRINDMLNYEKELIKTIEDQKSFTYEDWVYLYEICSKKWGVKDNIIYRVYGDTQTRFKDYIKTK